MAGKDRVHTLNEARSGRAAPPRRRAPRARAQVLPTDPAWLHAGSTVRLSDRGQPLDLFPISAVARGVGRSTGTIRRWIAEGLMPEPRYRTPGRLRCSQHRLWTREAVLQTAAAVGELGLTGRRPQRWEGSQLHDVLRATR